MRNSRVIWWALLAVLAAPWLIGVNSALVDILDQLPLGIPGRSIATVAVVVLAVVLLVKDGR